MSVDQTKTLLCENYTNNLKNGKGTWLSHLGVLRRLHAKLCYALNLSVQHLFRAHIVKRRYNRWIRYGGRQPDGPAGGGAPLVVLPRCSTSCNGQPWRPGWISPLCLSSTRFIVGLCLLIKTSTWPRLRVQDLPGQYTIHSTYCRPQTYSDALKFSFFPRTIPH